MSARLPGDAVIVIDGRERRLRLTLGALAHMEAHIGAGDLGRLFERLKNPGAGDLLHLLHALLIGGGEDATLHLLQTSDIDIAEAGRAIAKALQALAGDRDDPAPPDASPPGKPRPRAEPSASPGSAGFATR